MLAVSVLSALIGLFVLKKPVYDAVTGGVMIFLFSAPIGMLISTALPYFVASVKAAAMHSAILGEAPATRLIMRQSFRSTIPKFFRRKL